MIALLFAHIALEIMQIHKPSSQICDSGSDSAQIFKRVCGMAPGMEMSAGCVPFGCSDVQTLRLEHLYIHGWSQESY